MKVRFLSNLAEIYEGWKNDAFPTEEIIKMATTRAEICAGCPLNIKGFCSSALQGEAVRTFMYKGKERKQGTLFHGCGCPLSKKTKSGNSDCPLGKW